MTWGNGAAWLGIAFIALPVLIHLLGRGPARILRFPTLRFISTTRALPLRRTRLHDPLLLAVRIAILVAAVAALARPRFRPARMQAADRGMARAVIIDTSSSMQRGPQDAGDLTTLDIAHRRADSLAQSATVSTTLLAGNLPASLPGAAEWLARQTMRGEIVIVSDFGAESIDSLDLVKVPPTQGIRLVRIGARAPARGAESAARSAPATPRDDGDALVLVAAPSDSVRLEATRRAADLLARPSPVNGAHRVRIAFPGASPMNVAPTATASGFEPWMVDLAIGLRHDRLLIDAAGDRALAAIADSARALTVAVDAAGQPVVVARVARDGDRDVLVLSSSAPAGSLAAAALVAATRRAMSTTAPSWERDSGYVDDRVLQSWERAPSAAAAPVTDDDSASLSRWLWGAVLCLLIVETWLRRRPARDERTLISRERAA
jgi:hypothetical protein